MSTPSNGKAYLKLTKALLIGSAVQAVGTVVQVESGLAALHVANGAATQLDTHAGSLGAASYPKSFAGYKSLASTSIDLDLTALAGLDGSAGDTAFTTVNELYITNLDATNDLTVGNDGTGSEFYELLGTATETILIKPGETRVFKFGAGWTVTSHKKLKINSPSATVVFAIAIGGA